MAEKTKAVMKVEYTDLAGNEIVLTPTIVKKYLTNNPDVTEQELVFFLKLCGAQRLNPFLKEVYLVKYGRQAASLVVAKEAFLKRARRDPSYRGFKAWTEGKMEDMTLTATCEVFVEGFEVPISVTVDIDEYIGRTKDGSITGMWVSKPKTMLRKVALVQAHREAFPDALSGLFSAEEIQEDHGYVPPASEVKEEIQAESADRQEAAREAARAKKSSAEVIDDAVKEGEAAVEDMKKAEGVIEEAPAEKQATTVEEAQAIAKAKIKAKQDAEDAEAKEAKKKATAEKRALTVARKKAEKEAEEREASARALKAEVAEEARVAEEAQDEPDRLVIQGKSTVALGSKPAEEFNSEGFATLEYAEFIVACFRVAFEKTIDLGMLEIAIGCEADCWTVEEKTLVFDLYGQLQQGQADLPATLARLFPETY